MFSTGVRAVIADKLVMLGTLPWPSFILALKPVVVGKLVILGISYLT